MIDNSSIERIKLLYHANHHKQNTWKKGEKSELISINQRNRSQDIRQNSCQQTQFISQKENPIYQQKMTQHSQQTKIFHHQKTNKKLIFDSKYP